MLLNWIGLMVIPVAMILDALVGDPRRLPHPVRWMGLAITKSEPFFRRLGSGGTVSGGLFAGGLILGSWIMAWCLVRLGYSLNTFAGWTIETILLFYCLSARSLAQAAMSIENCLHRRLVAEARQELSFIVGRDVSRYGEDDIARATVETVAENFIDGVLSPLFFAVLGGAPLAVAYKMINTLDSMVGYKNTDYLYFGRAAARIDDAANFIPARLGVLVIALSALVLNASSGCRALKTAIKEGARHSSPNAGYPEAAFAGVLGIRLGGPNVYHGVMVEKPYIGTQLGKAKREHIRRACHLMLVSTLLAGLMATIGRMLFSWG
jgi:adenosylcobinamide-phosphate synthase